MTSAPRSPMCSSCASVWSGRTAIFASRRGAPWGWRGSSVRAARSSRRYPSSSAWRRPTRGRSSSVRRAWARSSSPRRSTPGAPVQTERWSSSIALRCRRRWSKPNCSGARRAPTPVPCHARSDASSSPTAPRSFSTRSASCRSTCRRSCCACCRKASSSGSEARERSG